MSSPISVVPWRRAFRERRCRRPWRTFVTATLRHATLYGSTYGWDARSPRRSRVDSALTSPSTKFLVASLLVQSAEPAIAEISSLVSETALSPRRTDAAARDQAELRRAAACRRIAPTSQRFDAAQTYLRNGGDRVAAGGVQQLTAALTAGQSTLATLQDAVRAVAIGRDYFSRSPTVRVDQPANCFATGSSRTRTPVAA